MTKSLRISATTGLSLLGAMTIGAGLMYLLDPQRGSHRRSLLKGQAMGRLRSLLPPWILQHLPQFARRSGAENGASHAPAVPDWVLGERVRFEVARTLTHPGSIEVSAQDGHVIVWGPVLAGEPQKLRWALGKVRGIRQLDLQLTTREESVAELQRRAG